MAVKKDIYYNGNIYVGVENVMPTNEAFLELWKGYITDFVNYPVTIPHPFNDGQDVTGLYELQYQKLVINYDKSGTKEWVRCSHFEYGFARGFKRAVAVPITTTDELEKEAAGLVTIFLEFADTHHKGSFHNATQCAIAHCNLMIDYMNKMGVSGIRLDQYTNLKAKLQSFQTD